MSIDDTEREAIRLAAMREVVEAMGRATTDNRPGVRWQDGKTPPLLIAGTPGRLYWVRPSAWMAGEPHDVAGIGGDTLLRHLGLID